MRRATVIAITIIIALGALILIIAPSKQSSPAPVTTVLTTDPAAAAGTSTTESVVMPVNVEKEHITPTSSYPFATLPEGQMGKPVIYTPLDSPTGRFMDFAEMSKKDQQNLATALMHEKRIHEDEIAFMKAELANKKLTNVTRNNLANALILQAKPDRELHKLFLSMIDDPTESPTLHEQEGRLKLDETFFDLTAKALRSEDVSDGSKTSLLAAIGRRKDIANIDLVRSFANQNSKTSLKRTAIAAIGYIGDTINYEATGSEIVIVGIGI